MEQIKRILENQKEIMYLGYLLTQDERSGEVKMELGTTGIVRIYKFKDENACLVRLIDILFEVSKLERWALKREGKKK